MVDLKKSDFWNRATFIGLGMVVLFFILAITVSSDEKRLAAVLCIVFWLIVSVATVTRYAYLKDREDDAVFKEAFGIEFGEWDADDIEDVQKLIDSSLRRKAKAFDDARRKQEHRFSVAEAEISNDAASLQELVSEVQTAKRAFWNASNIAKKRRFQVRERYTDWLDVPAKK